MNTVNLNDFIKVKLTQHGLSVHRENFDQELTMYIGIINPLPEYKAPEVDSEGYSKFSLWEFMNIFGSYFYNGCKNVVDKNEITFVKSN